MLYSVRYYNLTWLIGDTQAMAKEENDETEPNHSIIKTIYHITNVVPLCVAIINFFLFCTLPCWHTGIKVQPYNNKETSNICLPREEKKQRNNFVWYLYTFY